MRSVELAKVAASAEALRLRRMVRRQAMRGGFGAVAGVFALAVLVLIHVLVFFLLVPSVSPVVASLILLGADVVIAAVFGFLAARNTPDSIEQEAYHIRKQALAEAKQSLSLMSLLAPATRIVASRRAPGRALGSLAARLMRR